MVFSSYISNKNIVISLALTLIFFILVFSYLNSREKLYKAEIVIKPLDSQFVYQLNYGDQFFGTMRELHAKYNIFEHNEFNEKKYTFNQKQIFTLLRKKIDEKLIKNAIKSSNLLNQKKIQNFDQEVLNIIKKINLNTSHYFVSAFVNVSDVFYLAFGHNDPDKLKKFMHILMETAIKEVEKEIIINRRDHFLFFLEQYLNDFLTRAEIKKNNYEKYQASGIYLKNCIDYITNQIDAIKQSKAQFNQNTFNIIIDQFNIPYRFNGSLKELETYRDESIKKNKCLISSPFYISDAGIEYEKIIFYKELFKNDEKIKLLKDYSPNNIIYDFKLIDYDIANIVITKEERYVLIRSIIITFIFNIFLIFSFVYYYYLKKVSKKSN